MNFKFYIQAKMGGLRKGSYWEVAFGRRSVDDGV